MSTSVIHRRDFLAQAGKAALGATAATSAGPLVSSAMAQEKFPAHEVNWIIYQAPGGSLDTTARIIQPYLEKAGVKTTLDYVLGATYYNEKTNESDHQWYAPVGSYANSATYRKRT